MRLIQRLFVLLLISSIVCGLPSRRRGGRRGRPGGARKRQRPIRFAIRTNNVIDLTHEFNANSAYWPNNPSGFELVNLFSGFYSANMYSQPEHLGTHLDAPNHFSYDGVSVEKLSLYKLIGRGVLINLKRGDEKFDRDSQVNITHFLEWERENRRICSGDIVLIYTGYGDVYYDRPEYFGTNVTGTNSASHFKFPGLHPDAAEWLVNNRSIAAVGIDTASIDHGQSKLFKSHQILSKAAIPVFENVANLVEVALRDRGFGVIALPQKITGGTGAPLRIIAITE